MSVVEISTYKKSFITYSDDMAAFFLRHGVRVNNAYVYDGITAWLVKLSGRVELRLLEDPEFKQLLMQSVFDSPNLMKARLEPPIYFVREGEKLLTALDAEETEFLPTSKDPDLLMQLLKPPEGVTANPSTIKVESWEDLNSIISAAVEENQSVLRVFIPPTAAPKEEITIVGTKPPFAETLSLMAVQFLCNQILYPPVENEKNGNPDNLETKLE